MVGVSDNGIDSVRNKHGARQILVGDVVMHPFAPNTCGGLAKHQCSGSVWSSENALLALKRNTGTGNLEIRWPVTAQDSGQAICCDAVAHRSVLDTIGEISRGATGPAGFVHLAKVGAALESKAVGNTSAQSAEGARGDSQQEDSCLAHYPCVPQFVVQEFATSQ